MRTSLYVSGCTHHCKGCFNKVTWDFAYGKPFTEEVQDEIIHESDHPYIDGITILGGEPMEISNQKALRPFIEQYRARLPKQTVWLFSGYGDHGINYTAGVGIECMYEFSGWDT